MLHAHPQGGNGEDARPATIATVNGYRIVMDTKGRLIPGHILVYVDHGLALVSPQARAATLARTMEELRELPAFVAPPPGQSRI